MHVLPLVVTEHQRWKGAWNLGSPSQLPEYTYQRQWSRSFAVHCSWRSHMVYLCLFCFVVKAGHLPQNGYHLFPIDGCLTRSADGYLLYLLCFWSPRLSCMGLPVPETWGARVWAMLHRTQLIKHPSCKDYEARWHKLTATHSGSFIKLFHSICMTCIDM